MTKREVPDMTDDQIRKAAAEAFDRTLTEGALSRIEAVYRAGMEAGRAEAAAKPKRRKAAPSAVTVFDLVDDGVAQQHAEDWMRVRQGHKAPLTITAWDAMHREAKAAGITIAQAVQMCAERGWRGFRADYVSGGNQHARPAESFQSQAALARVQRIAPGAARKPTPLESDARRIYEACKASVLGEDDAGQPRLR